MLEELSVENYALIDRMKVRFRDGFNVLTGETGAGKSILAGALGLVLGNKAGNDVIRVGCEEAQASGVLRISGTPEAGAWLASKDIAHDEGYVVVRRVLRKNGRASAYIQSAAVTVADLQELTSLLVDMHGQHEHQSLFNPEQHRRFLDAYAGLDERVAEFGRRFVELSESRRQLEAMIEEEHSRGREEELLRFAVEEIGKANLVKGEDEALAKERKRYLDHEKVARIVDDLIGALAENRGGALAQLKRARSGFAALAGIDDEASIAATRVEDALFELDDVLEWCRAYQAGSEFDPARLEACEDRLALIRKLEKKYGGTIGTVLEYRDDAGARLAGMDNRDEQKNALGLRVREQEQALISEGQYISADRKKAAVNLEKAVVDALQHLGMKNIRFRVVFNRKEGAKGSLVMSPSGFDIVSFEISPNPGEPLKPLKSIASGGELSRIMLAIKTVLAESDSIHCLIFDEIDSGIGGEVAIAVGDFLRRLSAGKQVLCITHLASIAAQAATHYRVEKKVQGERTITDIVSIEGEERVREIARMLAGDPREDVSRAHAEELLRRYGNHAPA